MPPHDTGFRIARARVRIASRPALTGVILALVAACAGLRSLPAQTQRPKQNAAAQPSSRTSRPPSETEPRQRADEETADDGHPLRPALKMAYESREALKQVNDYTALFSKRERLGNRLLKQSMQMKVRENPFSVYLNFQGPEAGREVLYPDPRNKNNLLVHAEGIKAIAGTMSLALNSPEVTKENRYPMSEIGIKQLLAVIIAQWEAETKYGETEVKLFPNAKLSEVPCTAIQSSHPQPRKQFKFHMTRLYLDKQTNLPFRVEQYGWPRAAGEAPPIIEEYMYLNLKPNVGMTDRDFDPRNPRYHF